MSLIGPPSRRLANRILQIEVRNSLLLQRTLELQQAGVCVINPLKRRHADFSNETLDIESRSLLLMGRVTIVCVKLIPAAAAMSASSMPNATPYPPRLCSGIPLLSHTSGCEIICCWKKLCNRCRHGIFGYGAASTSSATGDDSS